VRVDDACGFNESGVPAAGNRAADARLRCDGKCNDGGEVAVQEAADEDGTQQRVRLNGASPVKPAAHHCRYHYSSCKQLL
jgi:hypothetical protein